MKKNISFLIPVVLLLALMIKVPKGETVRWEPYDPVALEQALTLDQPVLLYFYADWCAPCHEMERDTFQNPDIIKFLEPVKRLRIDMTNLQSEFNQRMLAKYDLVGVPTLIFYSKDNDKLQMNRVYGYVGPRYLKRFIEGDSVEGEI